MKILSKDFWISLAKELLRVAIAAVAGACSGCTTFFNF